MKTRGLPTIYKTLPLCCVQLSDLTILSQSPPNPTQFPNSTQRHGPVPSAHGQPTVTSYWAGRCTRLATQVACSGAGLHTVRADSWHWSELCGCGVGLGSASALSDKCEKLACMFCKRRVLVRVHPSSCRKQIQYPHIAGFYLLGSACRWILDG